MFDPKQFDELAKTLFQALPASVQNLEKEVQEKFKDVLQSAFHQLNLVTREEFDVQVKVLAKTREKLDSLQAQLDALLMEKNRKATTTPEQKKP
ncbi:MAG: accessory factor UbiK family protein [Legionellaceae bacterium]|nr:accessory factor UbiK family protein [Legionellaceae bacterium]